MNIVLSRCGVNANPDANLLLAQTVARKLLKLRACKGEYEVARL